MATPTLTMKPWMGVVRSFTTKGTPFRTPAPAAISQRCTKRWVSDTTISNANTPGDNGDVAARIGTDSMARSPSSSSNTTTPDSTPYSTSSQQDDLHTSPKKLPSPSSIRPPRAVQAAYLRPLRRTPTHGLPVCDLQLRSYNVRNLEFFADFCLRAAYYLGLPASGPVPLPRIVERWTVPKGSFIHKKSQENFERKTLRRLIQIQDGEAETVQVWLAFVRKYAYYGIGMKANVWGFEKVGVAKEMDRQMEQMRGQVEPTLDLFAMKKSAVEDKVLELINREDFRAASGGNAPMIRTPTYKLPKN